MYELTDRIRKLRFKMTELSDYLNVSRATLYRYVDLYNLGQKGEIPELSLSTFEFMMNSNKIEKIDVIYFISNYHAKKIMCAPIDKLLAEISKHIEENPDSEKTRLIIEMFSSHKLDDAISFIVHLSPYLDEGGNKIEGGLFDFVPVDSYFVFHETLKRRRYISFKEKKEK